MIRPRLWRWPIVSQYDVEGVLQQLGSPVDLKERPSNLFVASFIGEPPMNILKAHIAAEDGLCKVVVHDGDDKAAFVLDLGEIGGAIQLRDGQPVQLGIRPHKLQVGERNGAARPVNRIKGTLLSNQWLGDQSHVGISVTGCLLLAVTDRDVQLTTDSEITVGLPVEALHLFDAKDGRALCVVPNRRRLPASRDVRRRRRRDLDDRWL